MRKSFVTASRVATPAAASGAFVASECIRTILARRNARKFSPITTDSERLLSLAPDGTDGGAPPAAASGGYRLVEYLQPTDLLYFEAGRKSVSISDYSLVLTRLPSSELEEGP